MGFFSLFIIGIGLSMDAFAVSICKGLSMSRINKKHTFIIALFFGGFQAIMPLIGWLLGKQFKDYIVSVDHFIAFGLLAVIGGNMIREALKEEEEDTKQEEKLNVKELFLLAIATSIDALAVGITFAFFKVNILFAITIIGITTFLLSIVGVIIGNVFGSRYEKRAQIAGGVILILMSVKILLEHLGIIG